MTDSPAEQRLINPIVTVRCIVHRRILQQRALGLGSSVFLLTSCSVVERATAPTAANEIDR